MQFPGDMIERPVGPVDLLIFVCGQSLWSVVLICSTHLKCQSPTSLSLNGRASYFHGAKVDRSIVMVDVHVVYVIVW